MKFGRLLKTTSVDLPEMEALFSAYKTLKKHVKRLPYKEQMGQQGTLETLSEEENNFVTALSRTLHQLNEMFLEKEENSVIRVERLEHALAGASSPEQLNELHKQFVDFHGEVLLLVHWSILAYTATVKILKKHHKRTGLLVKAPQLGNLLSQPFCSTELMTSIAHRVEEDIQRLAERMGVSGQRNSEPTEQQHAQYQQQQQQQLGLELPAAERAAAAAAAVAAAAAASAAEVPQLPNGGLDLHLLQQLADSGSVTTPSDTECSREEDTAHHSGKHQQQPPHQQQLLQECSQQAHFQDRGTVSEVQHDPKRRRLVEQAAEAAVTSREADSNQEERQQQQHECAAAASQQQQLLEHRAVHVAAAAAAAELASPPHQQDQHQHEFAQPLPPMAPLLPQRCSTTGCAAADAMDEQQLHQHAHASGLHAGLGATAPAPCSVCARHGSILRQTQVALTTWQHLQSTASTPSTVVPGTHLLHASATVLTESSAV